MILTSKFHGRRPYVLAKEISPLSYGARGCGEAHGRHDGDLLEAQCSRHWRIHSRQTTYLSLPFSSRFHPPEFTLFPIFSMALLLPLPKSYLALGAESNQRASKIDEVAPSISISKAMLSFCSSKTPSRDPQSNRTIYASDAF